MLSGLGQPGGEKFSSRYLGNPSTVPLYSTVILCGPGAHTHTHAPRESKCICSFVTGSCAERVPFVSCFPRPLDLFALRPLCLVGLLDGRRCCWGWGSSGGWGTSGGWCTKCSGNAFRCCFPCCLMSFILVGSSFAPSWLKAEFAFRPTFPPAHSFLFHSGEWRSASLSGWHRHGNGNARAANTSLGPSGKVAARSQRSKELRPSLRQPLSSAKRY